MEKLTSMISSIKILLPGLLLLMSIYVKAQVIVPHDSLHNKRSSLPKISLDSILMVINQNNPMLRMYDQRTEAMKEYSKGARSWMAPMVGGGLWTTPYPGQNTMETQSQDKGMAMFSAEQEIPNPARLRANQSYLNSKAAIEEAEKGKTFNQLRAEARMLYFQWVVLEKKLAVLEENEEIMKLMIKLANIRYPYGQAKLSSIYKAEGRLYEVENMQIMAEAEIIQKNFQLNALMNWPVDTRYRVDTSIRNIEYVVPLIDTTELAANRSDIRYINNTINSMRLNVKLEEYQRKPGFKLRFDHMQPFSGMMPTQFTLMGMVSIPIAPWSSRMYRANVKGMNREIQAMELERQATLIESKAMIASMAAEINCKKMQLDNYQDKILPALRKSYDATMLAYQQNTEQLPAIIDAWETLNMAQMQYLENLQIWHEMIVKYEKELEK